MNLGPLELLIVVPIAALSYGVLVWAIVDAAMWPEAAYTSIGASKRTQIVVLVLTVLLCGPIGALVSIFYLLGTRAQLRNATARL